MDRARTGQRTPLGSRESLFSTLSFPAAHSTPENNASGRLPEPKSELLRSILKEKRAGRRPSSTSRRPSMSSSSYAGDEWIAASEGDTPAPARTTPRRKVHHIRRASVADVPSSAPASTKQMTVKETNDLITRLQNENFDVKLRLTLTQERVVKLEQQVQNGKERSERVEQLEERNTELEDQVARLQERLDALTKDKDALEDQHREDLHINDTLLQELEQREVQLHERDVAVEEAATLVHDLQQDNARLNSLLAGSKPATICRQSSDYFSSEAESQPVAKLSPKPSSLDIPESRPSTAHGSDYFSTGSSPRANPRSSTPRPLSRRKASLGRQMPRSPASSIESTTSTVDQHHPLPPIPVIDTRSAMDMIASAEKVRRPLMMMLRAATSPKSSSLNPVPATAHATPPSGSRALRNLYLSGELSRRIDIPAASQPLLTSGPRSFRNRMGSLTPEETYTSSFVPASITPPHASPEQDPQRSPSEVSVASDSTVSFHPNMGGIKHAPAYPPWPVTNGMMARDFLFNPHVDDLEYGAGSRRRRI